MWLLGSSGIPVKDQTVVILGHGRLVGQPLAKMMRASGAKVITLDENVKGGTLHADIVVSATGEEHLIKPGMVKDGAVVIDCGREVHPDLLANPNLKVTPPVGGVGPMTVAALFENLLLASI
jgi:methylenetetrahydrofolate dehydrogenase (NADP+)/methenyltetrahydrofolate cyclohydrolase